MLSNQVNPNPITTMIKLNGYGVEINNDSEYEQDGYVYLEHNQTYSIGLQNNNSTRCDAILEIDGKEMGGFRIPAYGFITIERPANVDRKFTFYKLGSNEGAAAELTADENLGLVSVTFKPEYTTKSQHNLGVTYTSKDLEKGGSEGVTMRGSRARGMSAGGTGLSERSSQRFTEVADLDYDLSKVTTIHLRLVCKEPAIMPLSAVTRQASTPIPNPIY